MFRITHVKELDHNKAFAVVWMSILEVMSRSSLPCKHYISSTLDLRLEIQFEDKYDTMSIAELVLKDNLTGQRRS